MPGIFDINLEDYLDDSVVNIMKYLRQEYGDNFAAYYEGDPFEIPRNSMPCIIVENIKTIPKLAKTRHDRLSEQISIRVVLDKGSDYGATDDFDTTERKLRLLVQGRDRVTKGYKKGTLFHALRSNITLGETVLEIDTDASYKIQARPNGVVTSEAEISVITYTDVPVPDRK